MGWREKVDKITLGEMGDTSPVTVASLIPLALYAKLVRTVERLKNKGIKITVSKFIRLLIERYGDALAEELDSK